MRNGSRIFQEHIVSQDRPHEYCRVQDRVSRKTKNKSSTYLRDGYKKIVMSMRLVGPEGRS